MFLTAFAGRDAAHHFGSICDGLSGVERAFAAGKALHDQARVFIDENAHARPPASFTTFSAASFIPSATVKLKPDSNSISRPFSTLVPSMRITTGTFMFNSRAAVTTPVARVSQRRIPPKILISTAWTPGSERRIRKA